MLANKHSFIKGKRGWVIAEHKKYVLWLIIHSIIASNYQVGNENPWNIRGCIRNELY